THDQGTPDRVRRSMRNQIMPLFYALGGMLAIWRLCRRRSYDIVHVHWPVPHALFGWVARKACGAAMVTLWYGVELRWVKSRLPWLKAFLRWAVRTSDQVVAISSGTAGEIAELVLPSIVDARGDTEGLGVVLLEAMSYHLPVVASNVGGITDIVADGETGLLVPPADPVALAAALERLATDAPLAERLADAGRRY